MRKWIYICLLIVTFAECRQPYDIIVPPEDTNFLVVQGFINSDGQTVINLSRTTLISDSGMAIEQNAVVQIEGNDNSVYPLFENAGGQYLSSYNTLNNNIQYRINIRTQEGKHYISVWRNNIKTSEIDSITFTRPNNGIEIYVNAKDPENDTRYYKWNYEETWEIRSKYHSNMVYYIKRDTIPTTFVAQYYNPATREYNDSIYYCWKDRISSGIKIGSTIKLTEDRVYIPLISYPQGAEELSVLYSVLIRQYGISKEGYEFYDKMKKNSESLGTIFDAQPSELKGNIQCLENPKEIIIGHIDISTVTERRVFINNEQLPQWNYSMGCESEVQVKAQNDSLMAGIHAPRKLPTYPVPLRGGGFEFIFAAEKICVDCTLRGSNIKPSFWPN